MFNILMFYNKPGNITSSRKNPLQKTRILIEIRWIKPPPNTIKLNIDEAFSKYTLEAGLGGVFRNNNGDWIVSYCKSTYDSSVKYCELMALHEGLKIAQELGFSKNEIETDSTDAISLLNDNNPNISNLILNVGG
ncbi:uncharacterized protein [Nicotiana sylvestris]|uniref:Uncharacterized protein LOC104214810 n=1 Tax=Nicotiana sylvestris TaxID=4096 RepID=A0A1U7V8X5_NICSY|nr:PREDICTED: uncharacterized protein LOC104214810 [Nicotiana sylvestris]